MDRSSPEPVSSASVAIADAMKLQAKPPLVAGQALDARNNNFNLIRMTAASAVLVSHAYPLALGPGTVEPLADLIGINLGTLAVLTFFAISGFFISYSFENRKSMTDFLVARFLRIYPALAVTLFLSAFLLGPLFTNLSLARYFSEAATYLYVPRHLILYIRDYSLPGIFVANPYPFVVNGSLWSLFYEVICYAMVAVVGVMLQGRRRFPLFIAIYTGGYCLGLLLDQIYDILNSHQLLKNLHELSLPFVFGMAIFYFRRKLMFSFPVFCLALLLILLTYRTIMFETVFVLAWSYIVFLIGFYRIPGVMAYNLLGDYSYGMYIYAFPVEQMVSVLGIQRSPFSIICIALPGTLLLAVLSWHFIEHHALRQRSAVTSWLRARRRV